MPVVTDDSGNLRKIGMSEFQYIVRDYKRIVSEIITKKESMKAGREGIADFALERDRILYNALFDSGNASKDVAYRKALIMQMLLPDVSNRIVSVRALNDNNSKRAVYDYLYSENGMNKHIMGLLTRIQSGEYKGDRDFAKNVLDDINKLKTIALLKSKNPNIDFELVKSRMFTEPASIEGFMTREKYLNQDIFDKTRVSDEITRTAAEVMVKYANGEGLVDPVLLYKASRQMASKGIDYTEQWANKRIVADDDGNARDFGIKERLITEIDALSRQDLGEKGGQGESASERIKNIVDCMRTGS